MVLILTLVVSVGAAEYQLRGTFHGVPVEGTWTDDPCWIDIASVEQQHMRVLLSTACELERYPDGSIRVAIRYGDGVAWARPGPRGTWKVIAHEGHFTLNEVRPR